MNVYSQLSLLFQSILTKEALDDFKIKCKAMHGVENHIVKWKEQEVKVIVMKKYQMGDLMENIC